MGSLDPRVLFVRVHILMIMGFMHPLDRIRSARVCKVWHNQLYTLSLWVKLDASEIQKKLFRFRVLDDIFTTGMVNLIGKISKGLQYLRIDWSVTVLWDTDTRRAVWNALSSAYPTGYINGLQMCILILI